MSDTKITIGNVCFLIDKIKHEILLLERSNEPMKGMYTGVGGKTNFNEDIRESCLREVKEETGLSVSEDNLKLKGIVKTILKDRNSSWILFVYVADDFSGTQIECSEGELKWIKISELENINLIGFIKEIIPFILANDIIIEGTIEHNEKGEVLSKKIVKVN